MPILCKRILGLALATTAAVAAERPNILIVVSDDQGYGDAACFGNPHLRTPHIDRLRRESTLLSRFYVAPLCSPTRAALMTGRHQFRTGVWDTWKGRSNLADDETTLAEYARRAGYRTGIFGKWHLGENAPFRPHDQGFDIAFINASEDRFAPVFTRNGAPTAAYDRFHDEVSTDEALAFMGASATSPFLACLTWFLPHTHSSRQIEAERARRFAGVPGLTKGDAEIYAMVERLDEHLGRLLDGLRRLDRERDTLVIFFSDNGPQFGTSALPGSRRFNAGLSGGKGSVAEGGIRVPCLMRLPGRLDAGATRDEAAAVIDLLPTLAARMGVTPSDKPLDGVDLWPLLTGSATSLPPRQLMQQQQPQNSGKIPQRYTNACVIEGRWKLLFTEGAASGRLFDVVADPGERSDRSRQEPALRKRLATAYDAWFTAIAADRGFGVLPYTLAPGEPLRLAAHYLRDDEGLRLLVRQAGRYQVQFSGIQTALLQHPEAALGLRSGEQRWQLARTDTGSATLAVSLPAGPVQLQPWSQHLRRAEGRYGDTDSGFRQLEISGPLDDAPAAP